MKKALVVFLLFMMMGCSPAAGPDEGGQVNWLKYYDVAREKSEESGKPMLIDFYADWCSWCKKMDQTTYSNKEVAEQINYEFVPLKVDASKDEKLSQRFNVRGLPTTVVVAPDGKVIKSIPGYLSPEQFLELLTETQEQQ